MHTITACPPYPLGPFPALPLPQVSAQLETAGTGVPIPADVGSLVEELVVLRSVRQYLQYLQVGAGAKGREGAVQSLTLSN